MTTATVTKISSKAEKPAFSYEGEEKEVAPELLYALVAEYRTNAANLAQAKKAALETEEKIKALLGGFEHLTCNGERLAHWPFKKLTKFDKKGLAKKYPAAVAEFTTEVEMGSRSFSVPGTSGVE